MKDQGCSGKSVVPKVEITHGFTQVIADISVFDIGITTSRIYEIDNFHNVATFAA